MNKFDAFAKLKEYSKNLSEVCYDDIVDLLKNGIREIPLPIAKIAKGWYIDRVRFNGKRDLFENIRELGYIKDQEVIDNILVDFGRSNLPHQVMFYGALETSQIDKPRFTAIAETSQLFRNRELDSEKGEKCTVSRWQIEEDILVVEVVFSEFALENNPDIRRSFENQRAMLAEHRLSKKETNFQLDFLKFISSEFSKKVTDPADYKICVAYTNIALSHPDVSGISYPSVQTEYFGVNLVLPPNVVDDVLKPIICSTQHLYKKGENYLIVNGEHFCKEIDPDIDITWQKHEDSDLTPKDEIQRRLNASEA